MKQLIIISFVAAIMLTVPGSIMGADKVEMKSQTMCPVMGGEIDKTIYADHKGERVYFCCNPCKAKFEADPEKYLKILAKKGEKPEKLAICSKCGEYKGSGKCCKPDAKVCSKCGIHKGSPGCCKPVSMKKSGKSASGKGLHSCNK